MLEHKSKYNIETFNLGTGRGLSVLELVNTFQKVNGVKVPYRIVDRREGDIEKVWADPAFANKELGWTKPGNGGGNTSHNLEMGTATENRK